MYTRVIEHEGSVYSGVEEVSLRRVEGSRILLDGRGGNYVKQGHGSGEGMFFRPEEIENPEKKTLELTLCSSHVLRVRYACGEELPLEQTDMVVREPAGLPQLQLQETPDALYADTGYVRIEIRKKPYALRVYGKDGQKRFAASNGECNSFRPLDAFSVGQVRFGDTVIPKNPSAPQYEYAPGLEGAQVCVESFDLEAGEHIYGLGEHFTGLDKRYQTIDLWTQDALGPVSQRQYKPVPFFVSSRSYGIFVNTSAPMTFWFGSLSNIRTVLAAEEDTLDYYVFFGDSMREVLQHYCDLTGAPPLPPKWSFGFWLSKFSYRSQAEALEAARRMREHRLPFDVLHLDTNWFEEDWVCDLKFGTRNFPDPVSMFRELRELGVHVSLWQMPYFDDRSSLFHEALERGFFPRTKSGEPALWKSAYGMTYGVLDVTNPAAVAWWKKKFRPLFALGADVIKTDFGEGAPSDAVYYRPLPGRKMHNLYPLLYNKAVFEVTAETQKQPFVWARSAWAGNQRYPVHWGGDNSGYFEQFVPQLTGGLSLMMSGFAFWSQDIAGFGDNVSDLELYLRWFQVGILMSHARLHGVGDREPYRFGEDVERQIRELLELRYRLMPYIYTSAFHAVRDRNPFLRPLVLDFQEDPHTADICDQFLFGDCIMAAPVLTQGGRRQVYFPQGTWYDFYTGERIEGGRYRSLEVPLSQVPLYVRGDSIIPCCSPGQKVTEGPEPEVLLRRYGTGVWELDYYDDYADGRVTRLTIEDDKTVKAVPARSTVFRLDEEWEARCAPGQEATGNGGEQA